MDVGLRSQFFSAMMRVKKMGSAFSSECDAPMNELAILQKISCECCGMNLNVQEIQDTLLITKPAISYILNTLEKKGFITREIDPRDRRKISITATAEGKAFAQQSCQKRDELWDQLLDRFGEDNMRQLVELLSALTDLCGEFCAEEKNGC